MTTDLHATAVAIVPVPVSDSNVQDNTGELVVGPGSTVTAGVRSASGPLEAVGQDTKGNAFSALTLNVQSYELAQAGAITKDAPPDYGTIDWSADVDILGGGSQLTASLSIDGAGNVTENQGFTVTQDGNVDQVAVLPTAAPTAYFFGEQVAQNKGFVPTFTFGPSIVSSITINDGSARDLEILPIDVTALSSKPEVILDSPTAPRPIFNFHIAAGTAQPTLVSIANTSLDSPFVKIDGIYNPIGQTIISSLTGDVDTGGGPITTHQLAIIAGGNAGGAIGGNPALVPLPIQMVQYTSDGGVVERPVLNVIAGKSVTLDLQGLLANGPSQEVFITTSTGILSGNGPGDNIVISTRARQQEGGTGPRVRRRGGASNRSRLKLGRTARFISRTAPPAWTPTARPLRRPGSSPRRCADVLVLQRHPSRRPRRGREHRDRPGPGFADR